MTRQRATPVSAQLRKWLTAPPEGVRTFSAVELAAAFEHPRSQKRKTTIEVINKELKKAHSQGEVVCFVDDRGKPLRVKKHVEPGSMNNEHPIIYGFPSSPSPEDGFRPAAHDEINRAVPAPSESDDAELSADPESVSVETTNADEASDGTEADEGSTRLDAISQRIRAFTPVDPAPTWVPDLVLARLVALPAAQAGWKKGLTSRNAQDRIALIGAGVRRKGDFAPDSVTALQLATLMKRDANWYSRLLHAVREHFAKKGPVVPASELVSFVDDPLDWALEHERVPLELVIATGLLADADEEALDEVASAFVDEPQAAASTVEERLRSRVEELQAVKDELSAQLRTALREEEKQAKVVAGLRKELEVLRSGHEETEESLQALADRRASELTASHEHVAELEAELEAAREEIEQARVEARESESLPGLQEDLDALRGRLEEERRLRQNAEAREQEQAARVRDLNRQLSQLSTAGMTLPVESAAEVLMALAGPVGEAATAAAERMATGQAQEDDFRLLELAASYGRLAAQTHASHESRRMDAVHGDEADDSTPARSSDASVQASPQTDKEVAGQLSSNTEEPELATSGPTVTTHDESDDQGARPPVTAASKAAQRRLPFTITPLGGAEEVGGSALVVQTPDGTVLLDAGQRVRGEYGDPELGQFHFSASGVDRLDAILVSHAHIDHVGSLPVLAQAYDAPVWMSEPTIDLSRIMLKDSAKIQESRTNRQMEIADLADSDLSAQGVTRAAYEDHDVNEVMATVQAAVPDQPFEIPGTDLIVRFQPVDHVLGACAIHLKHRGTGKALLYTGDLGPFTDPQETLPGRNPIDTLTQADVVIMESTYGIQGAEARDGRRRKHAGREQARQLLKDTAEAAFSREGFVLLPTFSLGRTQELLRILASSELPEAPIYVGGMGERITNLYSDWAAKREGGQWVPPGRFASGVNSINRWVREHPGLESAASEVLAEQKPGYLLVSPAMLSGGWSRAFLELMVEDPRHAVAFTGYLPRHAGGIRNVDRMDTGRTLELPDRKVRIACDWQVLKGLSAHAPSGDLRKFAAGMTRGTRVAFGCVHGEPAAQQELAAWVESSVAGATGQSLSRNTPWLPSLPQ